MAPSRGDRLQKHAFVLATCLATDVEQPAVDVVVGAEVAIVVTALDGSRP
jgi:hypothetical protein